MAFHTKRIYSEPDSDDGYRVLVDRLWPRGVSKERAHLDLWFKDIAPSPELRERWHHSAPADWGVHAEEYRAELADNTEAVSTLLALDREHGTVTLLYAAHDPEHNHAVVLLAFLNAREE